MNSSLSPSRKNKAGDYREYSEIEAQVKSTESLELRREVEELKRKIVSESSSPGLSELQEAKAKAKHKGEKLKQVKQML